MTRLNLLKIFGDGACRPLGDDTAGIGKRHGWSKIVVLGKDNLVDSEKTEEVIGDNAWWKTVSDGKKVVHFKIEWKDGVEAFTAPDSNNWVFYLRPAGEK